MITIRKEFHRDVEAREALLDQCFGDARFQKAAERLREGRQPAPNLSFVASDRGRVVGTARLWNVSAGPSRPALLLGPIAVHPDFRCQGLGGALVERSLDEAKRLGHRAVMLVGDAPYYERFGFSAACDRRPVAAGALRREPLPGARARARRAVRRARSRQPDRPY